MNFFDYTRDGFFVVALVAALGFSSCEKETVENAPVNASQAEPVVEEVDSTVPLIVHPVCLVLGEGGDAVFSAMLNRMLIKVTDARADFEMTSVDDTKNGIVVAVGEIPADLLAEMESRNLAVVRVGSRYASDPRVAAAIGVDGVFAAGQFGEAVRAAADDHGKVLICPVPGNNLSAADKRKEFGNYLERVAPRTAKGGYDVGAATSPLPDAKACESWLEKAITPSSRDEELAVIVGLTRQATRDGLLRLRAVGLAGTVPLVGYGIDSELVDAMDAGELKGVFLMDPGTLESALRVALDKAVKALDETEKVDGEKAPLVVPLRWLSFETLASDEGKLLAAPYLESEPMSGGE